MDRGWSHALAPALVTLFPGCPPQDTDVSGPHAQVGRVSPGQRRLDSLSSSRTSLQAWIPQQTAVSLPSCSSPFSLLSAPKGPSFLPHCVLLVPFLESSEGPQTVSPWLPLVTLRKWGSYRPDS